MCTTEIQTLQLLTNGAQDASSMTSSRMSTTSSDDDPVTWLASELPPHSFSIHAIDLPTKSVVVYADRAEVKRLVTTRLPKGTNEIIILNVSNVIERQSVRVDAQGVLIQEVQYQEIPLDTVTETEKVLSLEREQADLEMHRASIDDEMTSLRKRIEVLDGVAAQISAGPNPSPFSSTNPPLNANARRASIASMPPPSQPSATSSSLGFLVNDDALGNLVKFLNFYGDSVGKMRKELRMKQKEGERLSEQIEQLERQIGQLRCGYEYDSVKRNISIIVEADCERDVELYVTYQVYCASWKPVYDIRASTASDTEQPSTVTLCYYGLVEQHTGDNWKDCELILSTATPSIAGCAPPLPTLAASLHKTNYQRQRHGSARRKPPMSAASEEDMGFGSFDYNEMVDAAAMHRLNTHLASSEENSVASPIRSVETNIACTCFSVPRAVTVPSNGVEHKVLVAQVELACAFFHETVPSKCTSAFLSAMVTNTSSLPILAAPASVYVNNSFVSKTHLQSVSPGEEFRCTLGVDPAVKVEYKTPMRAQEQVGFVSKSTLLTHEQMISLRNAKVSTSVQITVREQIPKAIDDKIKVHIISPELKKGGDARLNREHNLEWTAILAPGQQKDLLIKYTVESPVNEIVAYRNMHG